jgi:heat-inducible transcriptional repressor
MREDLATPDTHVRIGAEVGIEDLEDCSYVLAPFGVRQSTVGGVGVLGPKRMNYRRARAVVEATADLVTDWLTQWELNA